MRKDDAQLGTPEVLYKDTKANIEAISAPILGMKAFASDIGNEGFYNGSAWIWSNTGAAGAQGPAGPAGNSTIVIYDDSIFKVTGTAISFDTNLNVANTGSVAFVSATGGGSGDSTYTNTFASRPSGTVNDGDLVFPPASDGMTIDRVTGSQSAYQSWGPIFGFSLPNLNNYSWINQVSGTATVEKDWISIYDPIQGNTNVSEHILKRPLISGTAYTYTVGFMVGSMVGVNYEGFGASWRQSSNGYLVSATYVYADNFTFYVSKLSSPTVVSANYLAGLVWQRSDLIWIRLIDNLTNRITQVSVDGIHFMQIHSVGRTDFLVADEIGIEFQSRTVSYPLYVNWIYESLTYP